MRLETKKDVRSHRQNWEGKIERSKIPGKHNEGLCKADWRI